MKYLTVAVPCYNSQSYMNKCIDSVLSCNEDVEIIIVNDGSSDNTGKIADEYALKFPDSVRVIHQENGGHGEGVNQGVLNATGLYFKVVDSDDWVNEDAIKKLIDRIKRDYKEKTSPDMYVCNYVYEHSADNSTYVMSYKNRFPQKHIFGWEETKPFGIYQYMMMHSVFFKTDFLKKDYVPLPKHTFYVDNLYMYRPLANTSTISYIDLDLYRYFIGREDQSVNEQTMIKRLDQQFYVTSLMVDSHKLDSVRKKSEKLYRYMLHHLGIMMLINASFAFLSKDREKINKFYKLWDEIRQKDEYIYKALRRHSLAMLTLLPGKVGRALYVTGYRIAKKFIKFG